nr:acyl-CoA carboxylase epsilon subunit [Actinomadura rayongensis]
MRIVRGDPTPAELAALVAVLAAAEQAEQAEQDKPAPTTHRPPPLPPVFLPPRSWRAGTR